jgi:hypothetical protein
LSHDEQFREDIIFYTGISEPKWNGIEVPVAFKQFCVSPVLGRRADTKREVRLLLPPDDSIQILQDSGAFSDSHEGRLSLEAAWDRQDAHSEKYNYSSRIAYRASYDHLVDETWVDNIRYKRRWSYAQAEDAVEETVAAARFADSRRSPNFALIQSAQGVEPSQYLRCVHKLIPFIDPSLDVLGFGGWCILGIQRKLEGVFLETIKKVIPFASAQGVKRIHIFGVVFPRVLGVLLWWSDLCGIRVSTDSTSPSLSPLWGKTGFADWRGRIQSLPVGRMGHMRLVNVCQTRQYLAQLRDTEFYREDYLIKTKPCVVCGEPVSLKATTCGDRCRKRWSRGLGKEG